MVFVDEEVEFVKGVRGSNLHAGMSDPKHDRDSDRESLTDWTLVDRVETPEDTSGEGPSHEENAAAEEEVKDAEEESGCAIEEDEEDEEALPEELISMGQRVQEIKGESIRASSGSDSSDIETLECPGPDDYYEDHALAYNTMHSSLLSSSLRSFTFLGDSGSPQGKQKHEGTMVFGSAVWKGYTSNVVEEADIESLASTDISIIDPEKEKPVEEEADLSLASSPSLPDDLPAIKPDTQYRHTRDKEFNGRLNVVVALTLACVIGLGLGHFLGWSSRTVWQESLNTAQINEALNLENDNLESEIIRLQQENSAPIKIHGKDGKYARDLRERINHLIVDNEELRFAVGKLKFASLPEGNTNTLNSALEKNYNLRLAVSKLTHLVPDLNALRVSANDLQAENQELQIQVGKLRYQQQPLPQELNAVARELEKFKKMVFEASQKKKVPPNLDNAKTYISYMSQILSAFHTWHEFEEGNVAEKIDIATDVFEDLVPKNFKVSSPVQEKLDGVRSKFSKIRTSLAEKWEKLKGLSQPGKLAALSRDSLSKMNRVIVNVVNKMKEIGQANIMKRGKAPLEKTIKTLHERFAALFAQFDKTWENLEAEVVAKPEDQEVTTEGHVETPEALEAMDTDEDDAQGIVEEDEDEVGDTVEEGQVETEALEEEVVETEALEEELEEPKTEEVLTEIMEETEEELGAVVGAVAEEEVLGEVSESEIPSTGATTPQGEGRRGGGDKKKLPDDKKVQKSKEKEEEEKEDGKKHRSRRSRVSEKEKKKEKKEAQKKEKEAQKKEKEAKKKEKEAQKKRKLEEKQKRKDRKQKEKHNAKPKQNHNHNNERNQKLKEKYNRMQYKGQHNRHDKKYWSDDEDDDDEDDDKRLRTKRFEDDKRRGLMRHWEKSPKKNHRRENSGPKKAFIRRHGKNHTRHDGEWLSKRAAGREHKRKEEQKSDWLFQRAKNRRSIRESERKADWLFSRAQGRKEMRYHDETDKFEDQDKYGHNKYEKHETRRRYVRFEDDDDDDDDYDDDDDEDYHYQQERMRGEHEYYPKKKGQQDWVIPNFSATGKTYYR